MSVTGLLRTRGLAVEQLQAEPVRAAAGTAVVPGQRRVLVMLLNFLNDASEPWSPQEARELVFTGDASVNAYYQEVSGGTVSLTGARQPDGDIFGWYTVPYNNTGCRIYDWRDAVSAAATANGYDLSAYDHVIFMFPHTSCGWGGFAWFLHRHSYINGAPTLRVVAHEIGHNLGLYHAASRTCVNSLGQRVAVGGTCTGDGYGDPFDIMGGALTRHFHGRHKGQLELLPPANILATSPGEQTVTLASSEEPLVGQAQEIRIPRWMDSTKTEYYSLDFRQPYGAYFDDFLPGDPAVSGVAIRMTPDPSSTSWLLDATPATATFADAPLPVGETFSDQMAAISITTLDVSPSGVTVRIVTDDDTDGDGCSDAREQQAGANADSGGGRDPAYLWDFYDIADPNANPQRDKVVSVGDIVRLIGRFGTSDAYGGAPINRNSDPFLSIPTAGYHPIFDRTLRGQDPWDTGPPNGSITVEDIILVVQQFGHSCL
ncbi:MAG: flexitail domain-containing putative surface protein [Dehalococcoidia bacterium]